MIAQICKSTIHFIQLLYQCIQLVFVKKGVCSRCSQYMWLPWLHWNSILSSPLLSPQGPFNIALLTYMIQVAQSCKSTIHFIQSLYQCIQLVFVKKGVFQVFTIHVVTMASMHGIVYILYTHTHTCTCVHTYIHMHACMH